MSFLRQWMYRCLIAGTLLALAGSGWAQSSLSKVGGEYPIAEFLPGIQIFPHVAVNEMGGFLVFQDNAVDPDGGIALTRLDANFTRVGSVVRVNTTTNGIQEKPQVALLKNGGAIVAWQSDKTGLNSDIFIRFLKPDGTFATGELQANKYEANNQTHPVVLGLPDGNALVVYTSVGQDGSLAGIFGRRFTPAGVPIGAEVQLNEGVRYHQRNPTVAVLSDGRLVIAWVTENVGSTFAYATIAARLFDVALSPLTPEFAVNQSASSICATPSVVALPQGGFLVAFARNDGPTYVNRTENGETKKVRVSPNDYQIFTRAFDSAGQPLTVENIANLRTYGDQFIPRLAASGNFLMLVWTSLGQDGSREGIFGRTVTADGEVVGPESQINSFAENQQMHPSICGVGGVGKFLGVWSSYANTADRFELSSQALEVSTIVARIVEAVDGIRITWSSKPGRNYQIQRSSDFVTWETLPGSYQSNSETTSVPLGKNTNQNFYRVIQLP